MIQVVAFAGVAAALCLFRWVRSAALFGCAALALWIFAAHAQRSVAPRCDRPPFGGSSAEYEGFMRIFGESNPANLLRDKLSLACEVKYTGAPRRSWHMLGITDEEIEKSSVEDLALRYAREFQSQ